MVERIKELCKEKGTNLSRLEAELGFANGTIKRWDKNVPASDRLLLVASYFDVTAEYLMTGEEKQPAPKSELSEDEAMLLDLFRSLPEDERKSVLLLLRRAAGRS